MARIFTTKFQYNHQHYDAIVTIIRKGENTSFTVKVLDLDLHAVIPGGELSYIGREGFKDISQIDNKLGLALMGSISSAIEEHLASID
jgi:hypothetical protein